MADGVTLLSDISPVKETWKIKVRIIRMWKQPLYLKPSETGSIDMILMDEEGNKIQANVKKNLIPKYDKLLVQGSAFLITNFGVRENSGKYQLVKNPHRISFYGTTSVKACTQFNGSIYGFRFTDFEDILSANIDLNFTVDVIGHIVGCGEIELSERNGRETRRLSLQLEDTERVKISCTLWDQFADQVHGYVSDPESKPGRIVLIIQIAKVRVWQGDPIVCNSYFGTRLFINSEIDEVTEFNNRLGPESPTQQIAQILSQNANSPNDSYLLDVQKRGKHVDQLREIGKPMACLVLGTIVCVQTEQNWYYLACRTCNKKAKLETEVEENKKSQVWVCTKCAKTGIAVVPRFKVQIRVKDDTGSISFVLFDREVSRVINKTAYELCEKLHETGDFETFPEELNEMVDKKFVFKIEVSSYNINNNYQVYTVLKMTDDDYIMSAFPKSLIPQETMSDVSGCTETPTQTNVAIKLGDSFDEDSENWTGKECGTKRTLEMTDSEDSVEMSSTKMKLLIPKVEEV